MVFSALRERKQSDRGINKEEQGTRLDDRSRARRFEDTCMVHLNAAHNLAYWLARDQSNAEDIVQEACLRAYKFMESYDGSSGRAWFLAIVRNTFYTWLEKTRVDKRNVEFDEDVLAAHGYDMQALEHDENYSIDQRLQQEESRRWVNRALALLPAEFREVIVLRELEELSYKEISTVAGIPVGTVMSRLSRARNLLLQHLNATKE
jgi:RNA polymerase sigma factor (sigma-70 family)